MWVYLWAASSVPFIHMSVFVPISAALITVTLQYCLKSGRVMPLALFLSLRITLAILGLLWLHINFKIICSSSVKNIMGNLIGITLNLYTALGSVAILTILILPIQEYGKTFHCFKSPSISFSRGSFRPRDQTQVSCIAGRFFTI